MRKALTVAMVVVLSACTSSGTPGGSTGGGGTSGSTGGGSSSGGTTASCPLDAGTLNRPVDAGSDCAEPWPGLGDAPNLQLTALEHTSPSGGPPADGGRFVLPDGLFYLVQIEGSAASFGPHTIRQAALVQNGASALITEAVDCGTPYAGVTGYSVDDGGFGGGYVPCGYRVDSAADGYELFDGGFRLYSAPGVGGWLSSPEVRTYQRVAP